MNITAKLRHTIEFKPFLGLSVKGDELFGSAVTGIPTYIDETVSGKRITVNMEQKTLSARLLLTNPSTIGVGFKAVNGYDQFGNLILVAGRIVHLTKVWHYRKGRIYMSADLVLCDP